MISPWLEGITPHFANAPRQRCVRVSGVPGYWDARGRIDGHPLCSSLSHLLKARPELLEKPSMGLVHLALSPDWYVLPERVIPWLLADYAAKALEVSGVKSPLARAAIRDARLFALTGDLPDLNEPQLILQVGSQAAHKDAVRVALYARRLATAEPGRPWARATDTAAALAECVGVPPQWLLHRVARILHVGWAQGAEPKVRCLAVAS